MRRPDVSGLVFERKERLGNLTRSTTLTGYRPLALSLGLDPAAMLQAARIPEEALEDPCAMVSVDSVAALLESSAMRSGEPAFGLLLAEQRRLSNLGMLGLVVREEATVRGALQCLVKYVHFQNRGLDLWMEDLGQFSMLHFGLRLSSHVLSVQGTEMTAGVVVRTVQSIARGAVHPASVSFIHGRPGRIDVHKRVLGTKLDFAQAFNAVIFRNQELDLPIPGADPAMTTALKKELDLHLAQADDDPTEAVRQVVRLLLPKGNCSVERVAEYLGAHRRTLGRRLAASGDSVSTIVDEVRSEMARTYLHGGQRTHYQIAHLLGFASGAEFSRWFRMRFGMTASQWEAAQQADSRPSLSQVANK